MVRPHARQPSPLPLRAAGGHCAQREGRAVRAPHDRSRGKARLVPAISPLGKVPLLKVARPGAVDVVLFESAAICEFIEETQAGPALHPADPIERAEHRAWIEFASATSWPTSTPSIRRPMPPCSRSSVRVRRQVARLEQRWGRSILRRRAVQSGRRRLRAGVPLLRCVRRYRRPRHSRRQAEGSHLAPTLAVRRSVQSAVPRLSRTLAALLRSAILPSSPLH